MQTKKYRPRVDRQLWLVQHGHSPIISCALYNGHLIRPEIADILALSEEEQLREENPYTAMWTTITDTRIIGLRSRFELDFNRPKETAIYSKPDDVQDMKIWKHPPGKDVLMELIKAHKTFYSDVYGILKNIEAQFGCFVVFDFQSYNHRRAGEAEPCAPQKQNPDINIGTNTMHIDYWNPLIDGFIEDLRSFDFMGNRLDIRKNIKFKGSYFTDWVNHSFPKTGCAIVVDVKKIFMDEWTGDLFPEVHESIRQALLVGKTGMLRRLQKY